MSAAPNLNLARLLEHRASIGDQVFLDWLDVVRLTEAGTIGLPGPFVRISRLMAAWGVAQCSVSRRIKAINAASAAMADHGSAADGHRLGRVVRAYQAPGFWRVVFHPED